MAFLQQHHYQDDDSNAVGRAQCRILSSVVAAAVLIKRQNNKPTERGRKRSGIVDGRTAAANNPASLVVNYAHSGWGIEVAELARRDHAYS